MEKTKIKLIDTPLTDGEDFLNVTPYVNALSNIIKNCDTPMTIAIQGDWGSGKTSFMNLVKKVLMEEKQKYDIIDFNTWQYSKFNMDDYLAISLLNSLANEVIERNIENEYIENFKNSLKNISVNLLSFASRNVINKDTFKYEPEETFISTVDKINKLKDTLQEAINKIIEDTNFERVVFFIDDLDRLNPEKAVDLLEVLQLFLNLENCVFVLAVDYDIVVKGINSKLGTNPGENKGKNFFDKIIQLPFTIPSGTDEDVKNYTQSLLENISELDKFSNKELTTIVKFINNSVQFNPRNIKRVINAYWLLILVYSSKQVSNSIDKKETSILLFAVLCLQMKYDVVYQFLIKNVNSFGKLNSFVSHISENKEDDDMELNQQIDELKEDFDNMIKINSDREWMKLINFMNEFVLYFDNVKNKDAILQGVLDLSKTTSQDSTASKTTSISYEEKIEGNARYEKAINKYKEVLKKLDSEKIDVNTESTKNYISMKISGDSIGCVAMTADKVNFYFEGLNEKIDNKNIFPNGLSYVYKGDSYFPLDINSDDSETEKLVKIFKEVKTR
ncbi:KAP family P-loop NTPase fold protein [Floricoccus penangensis]|uniref:KAP family P-loop NTPase fold protein n=1 Tax=Floricoccus penangensis TaxID=1859475 RepID=UPI002041754F|nr:P-loop NTPase fold protein [Floricoccus penangensis]URZ86618.1 KAP family NTPase [Floricoccus penangensis]